MRPLGVTLVGFYQILRGVLSLLFGLCLMAFTGLAAKLASLAAEGNAVERLLSSFGHIAGLAIIVFGVIAHACRLRRLADAELGTSADASVLCNWLVLVLPARSRAPSFAASSVESTPPRSFIWRCPRVKRAFHAEGSQMRMAA